MLRHELKDFIKPEFVYRIQSAAADAGMDLLSDVAVAFNSFPGTPIRVTSSGVKGFEKSVKQSWRDSKGSKVARENGTVEGLSSRPASSSAPSAPRPSSPPRPCRPSARRSASPRRPFTSAPPCRCSSLGS